MDFQSVTPSYGVPYTDVYVLCAFSLKKKCNEKMIEMKWKNENKSKVFPLDEKKMERNQLCASNRTFQSV